MFLSNLIAELKLSRIKKALDAKQFSRAHRLGKRFVAKRPTNAAAWFLLGEAARAQNRIDEALRCYNEVVSIQPHHPIALRERGLLLLNVGNIDAGEKDLMTAHSVDPLDITVTSALSSTLLNRNRPDVAEVVLQETLDLIPEAPDLLCNLALVRLAQQRQDEAVGLFRRTLLSHPEHRLSRLNLAHALVDMQQFDEAKKEFGVAITGSPQDPDFLAGLATVDYAAGNYETALVQLERISASHPTHYLSNMYLGLTLRELRRFDEASACFRRLTTAQPGDASAQLNLAFVLLAQGHYAEGWRAYEYRKWTPETPGRVFDIPEWNGQSTQAAVLLYGEQGLGDEIMFASCIPDAARQASNAYLQCDPRLGALYTRSFPQLRIVPLEREQREAALRQFLPMAAQLPVGSLPSLFRRNRGDFPAHQGYLSADPMKIARWQDKLPAKQLGPRIGICWRGGITQTNIASRTIALARWRPILAVRGAQFVSLQHGAVDAEIAEVQATQGITIHYYPGAADNIDEFAALIGSMDLVISVQATTVHFAGALGCRCWVLLPFSTEWRYLAEGETMPWYPSVKLYRQPAPHDWDPVLAIVATQLNELIR